MLTEQARSIKDLCSGQKENFFLGTKEVIPSGRDGPILPARVANQNTDFASFFPADSAI